MRHDGGGNVSKNDVKRFLGSIRGMHVENANIKFDLHHCRADGVDLTQQDNTFGDAQHYAAILDDDRLKFNIDDLSMEFLGWDVTNDGLGKLPDGIKHEGEFRALPAWVVAPYAERNVEQVRRLIDHFTPDIVVQNLLPTLHLEQQIIPVVVETEKNGTFLDLRTLERWVKEVPRRIDDLKWEVYQETGVDFESPNSARQCERVAVKLGLGVIARTAGGAPSFTDAVLKQYEHPTMAKIRLVRQLTDLNGDYVQKYADAVRADGWLRYNLHQLRNTRDRGGVSEDKKGAVSGRFSAAGDKEGGYNPQQVVSVEKQLERGFCPDYLLRSLFVCGPDEVEFLASDMMQVEYRLFANYARSRRIFERFESEPTKQRIGDKDVWVTGPLADFHALVWLLLNDSRLNRKLTKNINFAKIYGAGLLKFALMTGKITEQEFDWVVANYGRCSYSVLLNDLPFSDRIQEAHAVNRVYDREFPEVGPLLERAKLTAMPECENPRRCRCQELGIEHRGFVTTLNGRRARFTKSRKYHSALNRIIQGGAADWNKRVLIEVHKHCRSFGFVPRLTVHDELAGGLMAGANVAALDEILNAQYFKSRVPILWETKRGANWAACK